MAYCETCENDLSACKCESQTPYCDPCSDDNPCAQIMDADCVIYHPDGDSPSELDNLDLPNGSSVEDILEAIDDFLGNAANVPITVTDTPSVNLTSSGVAGHTIKAEVKLSADEFNQLEERADGLYSAPFNQEYKVKVDSADAPAYLEAQIIGGTDGIVSITVVKEGGQLKIVPTLNIDLLLNKIKEDFGDKMCDIVSECVNHIWIVDTYECQSADLDLIEEKTVSSLPEPSYTFEDGGRLYFVSASNLTGKVWSVDPSTFSNVSEIEYLNETRSGTPYGASGGTYYAGSPYKANASGAGSSYVNGGHYYDAPTRTLYIHSNRSYGCDYYDFNLGTWNKISVGSTGSAYTTTSSSDYYTHIFMHSHADTNFLITGWGTNSGNRGSRVVIINKSTKEMVTEIDTVASPVFAGITGNPFNLNWGARFTSDGRIFVGKANVSEYKDLAVFSSTLVPIIEITLPNSSTGFNGDATRYWQNMFLDRDYNKVYVNDYVSRTLDVYDTDTYAHLKTFNFDNNREYVAAEVIVNINPITEELFCDVFYGDNLATTGGDAPSSETVSYKINRDTLEIEKTYIGTVKAYSLTPLSTGQIVAATPGAVNPPSPTSIGEAVFSVKNPDSLKNGMVNVLTLKQVSESTSAPTGLLKENTASDPDYIAPYMDTDLCPVSYTLAPPSNTVLTATDARYSIDFGLNDDVVMNPALFFIKLTIKNLTTAATLGTKTWTIPNTPNPNAFLDEQALAGITVGDNISIDIQYLDAVSTPIVTFANIKSFTAIAD